MTIPNDRATGAGVKGGGYRSPESDSRTQRRAVEAASGRERTQEPRAEHLANPALAELGSRRLPAALCRARDAADKELVKSVFQKTETRRQAELVAMIARLSFQPTER